MIKYIPFVALTWVVLCTAPRNEVVQPPPQRVIHQSSLGMASIPVEELVLVDWTFTESGRGWALDKEVLTLEVRVDGNTAIYTKIKPLTGKLRMLQAESPTLFTTAIRRDMLFENHVVGACLIRANGERNCKGSPAFSF